MIMLEEFDAMVRQIFMDGRKYPDSVTGEMGSRTWNSHGWATDRHPDGDTLSSTRRPTIAAGS